MLRRNAAAMLAGLLALSLAGGVRAGDNDTTRKIGVTARGQTTAQADALEIEFTVTAHTEDATEAEKKFKDKLSRIMAALKDGDAKAGKKKSDDDDDDGPKKKKPEAKKPTPPKKKKKTDDDDDDDDDPPAKKKDGDKKDSDKKDGDKKDGDKKDSDKKDEKKDDAKKDDSSVVPVEVTERNFSIGVKGTKDEDKLAKAMAGRMGVQPEKNDSPMTYSTKVVATINSLKTLDRAAFQKRVAQLIDVGIDAGAEGPDGEAPVVRFIVKDFETVKKAAYKDAMSKAKERATSLAELAGKKLGDVISVVEAPVLTTAPKPDNSDIVAEKVVAMFYGIRSRDGDVVIPVNDVQTQVELRVEYELK
jgi:uncharacterized protein YggE